MSSQKPQILIALALMTFLPLGSAGTVHDSAVGEMGIVTLSADAATGTWSLTIADDLVCDVPESTGVFVPGQAVAFSVTCASTHILGDVVESGRTCWGVGAETETVGAAEAEVTTTCGTLSASCDSESRNGGRESCYDEEWGNSGPPMNCEAEVWAAWWDYGSRATATCYYWVSEDSA